MSSLSEDKLLSLLAEILSDIRQIKSDLQELRTQQQQTPPPVASSDGDYTPEPDDSGRSASPEEVLRYLRETRGEDDS
jgi:hypothetical protein